MPVRGVALIVHGVMLKNQSQTRRVKARQPNLVQCAFKYAVGANCIVGADALNANEPAAGSKLVQIPEAKGLDIILGFHRLAGAEEVIVFIVNFCPGCQQAESSRIGFPVELGKQRAGH